MTQPLQLLQKQHFSWEALGLLAFLLAHPGQGFSIKELQVLASDQERVKAAITKLVSTKRARFVNGRVFAIEGSGGSHA